MAVNDIAVQEFVNAIKEPPQDTNKTYNATVSHIDEEGVVWVNIHGSDKETPTASTSSEVKRGDNVTVQWRNNKLYIGGNYSNPSAGVETVRPSVDYVAELIDRDVTVKSINAATGYIGELTSEHITADDIQAGTGYIKELKADNIEAEDIVADHGTIGSLDVNYAKVNAANIDSAAIRNAWVDKIMVQTGLLAYSSQVYTLDAIEVNAANITAGTLDVNRLIVTVGEGSSAQKYLVNIDPSTGTPSYEKLDGNIVEPRTITANKIVANSITTDEITVNNLVGTSGWINLHEGKFFYGDGASFASATNAISWNGSKLQIKADEFLLSSGKSIFDEIEAIETWFYSVPPTTSNPPANSWTTTNLKEQHLRDIYFDTTSGKSYRWAKEGSTYKWVEIQDVELAALAGRVSTNETNIAQNSTQIQSKASQSSVNALTNRVSTAESTITQQATAIEAKVSKDGVIASINASVEKEGGSAVKIHADKVNIEGAAIFTGSGRLSTTSLNNSYDAKGAASTAESNAKGYADNAVDGIEIGGRNLARGTANMSDGTGLWSDGTWRFSEHSDVTYSYTVNDSPVAGVNKGVLLTTPSESGRAGITQDHCPILSKKLTYSVWAKGTAGGELLLQSVWWSGVPSATNWWKSITTTGSWQHISFTTDLTNATVPDGNCSICYAYFKGTNVGDTCIVLAPKLEYGTKATDWTPAPEDIPSIHTLMAPGGESGSSATYAQILTWCKEGTTQNWDVTSAAGVKKGDTVRVGYYVSNMGTAGSRPVVYCVGTVIDILNANRISMTMHGLDTTIIDGGNIIANSIGANQLDANNINVSNKLTIGALSTDTQSSILNSNVQIGGTNLIPLSRNLKSFTVENVNYGPVTFTNVDCYLAVTTPNTSRYGLYKDWGVDKDTTYTLSFYSSHIAGTINVGIGNRTGSTEGWNDIVGYKQLVEGRNTVTFTTPSDVTKIRIYIGGQNGSHAYIWKLKLEKGNKATDWSPAVDDMAGAKYLASTYSQPYSTYVSWVNGPATDTYSVASSSGVNVGDIVLIECACTTTGKNLYIQGEVTAIPDDTKVTIRPMGIVDKATYSSKTATNYITDITNAGIYISPANQTPASGSEGNSVQIDGTGMTVYTGSTSVAFYGNEARIGKADKSRVYIMPDNGMRVYDKNNKRRLWLDWDGFFVYDDSEANMSSFTPASIRLGKAAARHLTLDPTNGLQIFTGTESDPTNVAQFNDTVRVGKKADTNIVITPASTDSGIKMNVKNSAGTSSVRIADIGFDSTQGYETNKNFPKGAWFTLGDRAGTAAQRGYFSFVSGFNNIASHNASAVFGINNKVYSPSAISAGMENVIGDSTKTSQNSYTTNTVGNCCATFGYGLIASGQNQLICGAYNVSSASNAFMVGIGTSSARKNAFVVTTGGDATLSGRLTQGSDRRLKEHISYLGDDAVEFVSKLKPAFYKKDGSNHVGFYAQDVEEADKWNCMTGEMNGFMTLGYTEIIAPLVKYVQKLEERIKELERSK